LENSDWYHFYKKNNKKNFNSIFYSKKMILQTLILNEKVKKSAHVTGANVEGPLSMCVILKYQNFAKKQNKSEKLEIFLKRMTISVQKLTDFVFLRKFKYGNFHFDSTAKTYSKLAAVTFEPLTFHLAGCHLITGPKQPRCISAGSSRLDILGLVFK